MLLDSPNDKISFSSIYNCSYIKKTQFYIFSSIKQDVKSLIKMDDIEQGNFFQHFALTKTLVLFYVSIVWMSFWI